MKRLITFIFPILFSLSVFQLFAEVQPSTEAFKTLKAENSILLKALTPEQKRLLTLGPELKQCTGTNNCNCRAGSYGYCTTKDECDNVGGTCS